MPSKAERIKTGYPGVTYIMGRRASNRNRPEKIFYIRYFLNGKQIEERVGRQYQHNMTPARAARIRADKIEGRVKTNRERRAEQKAAKLAEQGKWTITRLWEKYLEGKAGNLKGIVTDTNRFEKHIEPVFGDKEPCELFPLDVDRFRIRMSKTLKPATVRNTLELLRRIINFGTDKQLCPGLSFKIKMPDVDNEKTEDLTPEQLKALLDAIEADDNRQAANLMKMALFTGMRRGELFKLKWSDIDFDRGFIRIVGPKGGRDQVIPLNEPAREILAGHVRTGSEFVFPGRNGERRTDIKAQVGRIKEAAGLPKAFRPLHGLRHVYASMLASSGKVDMYTLQKLLTHKSPSMTQRYAHLRDESLRNASNLAGDIIKEAMNAGTDSSVIDLIKKK